MSILKDNKIKFTIGAIFLLLLLIGAAVAYFQIVAINNTTNTTIGGKGDKLGQATLVTKTDELNIKITAENMRKDNINKIFFAEKDGKLQETEGIGVVTHTLATASVTESDVPLDCIYAYDISATTSKPITDGSDSDVGIIITSPSGEAAIYWLSDLLDGVTHVGEIKNLVYGENQSISIEVGVINSDVPQNDLSGNEFTITLKPKSGSEGFSCESGIGLTQYSISYLTDITDMTKYDMGDGQYIVKVSDKIPQLESIYNAAISAVDFQGNSISGMLNKGACYDVAGSMYCVYILVIYEEDNAFGLETGVYLPYGLVMNITVTEEEPPPEVVAQLNNNTINANVFQQKLEPKEYCVNTSQWNTDDCEWQNLRGTTISSQISDLGTYYVHVKDEVGFIGHSNQIMKYNYSGIAKTLIDKGEMTKSGLENDAYRYTGTSDKYCEYDKGKYRRYVDSNATSCPKAIKYITNYVYYDHRPINYGSTCPEDNPNNYTYDCTELTGTLKDGNQPDNFICFGITSKSECTSTTKDANGLTGIDKYMYRIIGAFPDNSGNLHLKLISYKQLGNYQYKTESPFYDHPHWGDSTLKPLLNGSEFLNNAKYSYLQNTTWLNKIENWEWKSTNSHYDTDRSFFYYANYEYPEEVYFHEMDSNSNIWLEHGLWNTTQAKIGLLYVSDILLTLDKNVYDGSSVSWLAPNNNDVSKNTKEWTITGGAGWGSVYTFGDEKPLYYATATQSLAVRPTFYLTSNTTLSGGTGTLTDPYMINANSNTHSGGSVD